MTQDFDIHNSAQLRAFDRALFDFLSEISRRGEPASVFVAGDQRRNREVKSVACDCPKTALRLAGEISRALKTAAERGR